MRIFDSIGSGLKGLAIDAALPFINMVDSDAGTVITDVKNDLADGHITLDEAQKTISDTLDGVAHKWPEGAPALESLKQNIAEDLPKIVDLVDQVEAIVPNIERTVKLFEQIGKPTAPASA